MLCRTIYIYLFWCKLNPLILVGLLIQKVISTGRLLHHTPQIYRFIQKVISTRKLLHQTSQIYRFFFQKVISTGRQLHHTPQIYRFIQKVISTGRLLHHTPQIYIVVICHWVSELSLQVINASHYTQHSTGYKHQFGS